MTVNVPIEEFKIKWKVADRGENLYTKGSLTGKIVYEDDTYIVIELIK